MKDWFLGAIGGVVATAIGFVLAILWDIYKMRKEGRQRTRLVVTAIAEELASNKKLTERNMILLRNDIQALPEKKSVVQPLLFLKIGFWDVAKFSLSQGALAPDRLMKLRQAVTLAEQANEEIRSRETYRLHNGAMSNFHGHMAIYDEALLRTLEELNNAMAAYEAGGCQQKDRQMIAEEPAG